MGLAVFETDTTRVRYYFLVFVLAINHTKEVMIITKRFFHLSENLRLWIFLHVPLIWHVTKWFNHSLIKYLSLLFGFLVFNLLVVFLTDIYIAQMIFNIEFSP
ncbi:hypothetical protein ACJX0J_017685 [Zea mays]